MSDNNFRVLLIVDELFGQQATADLQLAGYIPVIAKNGVFNDREFTLLNPAMVAIDKRKCGENTVALCHHIRSLESKIPILILVEEETVEERIICLEAGADDYILKPYNKDSLLKLIRFYLEPRPNIKEQLRFGELILDLTTRQVILEDKVIDLTIKEFELLKYLMSNPGKVLSREDIIKNVWGYDYQGESNVIEVYIRYLRIKIEADDKKRLIQTVRGVGYVLREN